MKLLFATTVLLIFSIPVISQEPEIPRHPCEHPETWKIDREYGRRVNKNCGWEVIVVPSSQCAAYAEHYGLTCDKPKRRQRRAVRRAKVSNRNH